MLCRRSCSLIATAACCVCGLLSLPANWHAPGALKAAYQKKAVPSGLVLQHLSTKAATKLQQWAAQWKLPADVVHPGPSSSLYTASLVAVKQQGGQWRLCFQQEAAEA